MKFAATLLLAALLVGTGSLSAQDKRRDYSEEKLKLRAEMMALDMAEKYGLDEKQVEKLTKANMEWLQKGGMPAFRPGQQRDANRRWADRNRRRYHRHQHGCCGAPHHRGGHCNGAYCEDGHHVAGCPYANDGQRQPLSKEELEKHREEWKASAEKRREEWQKAMEKHREARKAYEESLRKIMTDEQYETYRQQWHR